MSKVYVKCMYCKHSVGVYRCNQKRERTSYPFQDHICPDFLRNDEEINCANMDSPVCPYCGYDDYEWDCCDPGDDGDVGEYTCTNCGKEYYATTHIEYSFTSREKELNAESTIATESQEDEEND